MSALFTKKYTIAVHDGRFHSDDIFACAVLHLVHKGNIVITRTREKEIIAKADYILDVGGVYDHARNMYDHHQTEGAGVRDNGIPYATFGLVWKHYGPILTNTTEVLAGLDRKIAQPIDAGDNGVTTYDTRFENLFPYSIQDVFATRMPAWDEDDEIDLDTEFNSLVSFAADLLKREIEKAESYEQAKRLVKHDYDISPNKDIIILSNRYPFEGILPAYPEPLIAIYQRRNGLWGAEGVPVKPNEFFKRRQYFPEEWSGLRDEALVEATGVKGALFCHKNVFMCVGKTKEDVLALANKALKN